MIVSILILAIAANLIYVMTNVFPSVFRPKYSKAAIDIYTHNNYKVVGTASDGKMKLWILKDDAENILMPVITKNSHSRFGKWDFHIYDENKPNTVMLFSPVDPMARKIINKLKPVIEEYERENSL